MIRRLFRAVLAHLLARVRLVYEVVRASIKNYEDDHAIPLAVSLDRATTGDRRPSLLSSALAVIRTRAFFRGMLLTLFVILPARGLLSHLPLSPDAHLVVWGTLEMMCGIVIGWWGYDEDVVYRRRQKQREYFASLGTYSLRRRLWSYNTGARCLYVLRVTHTPRMHLPHSHLVYLNEYALAFEAEAQRTQVAPLFTSTASDVPDSL